MKIKICLFLMMLFLFSNVKASDYFPNNLNYLDFSIFNKVDNKYLNNERIRIKPNTTYTFFHKSENSSYMDLLIQEECLNLDGSINLLMITESKKMDYEFDFTYMEDIGEIAFVNFTTSPSDNYLYTVSFCGNEVVKENDYFALVEGELTPNLVLDVIPYGGENFNLGKLSEAYDGVYPMNVDEEISIDDIKQNLIVNDNIDGDLSNEIFIMYDTFTLRSSPIGNYYIRFGVSDSSNNFVSYCVKIIIYDISKPVFSGTQYKIIYLSDGEIDLLSFVSAIDNVDGDLSEFVYLIDNPFLYRPGQYLVTYGIEDSSFNLSTYQIRFVVYDDILPVISIEGRIIDKAIADNLSVEDLKNMLIENLHFKNVSFSDLKIASDGYSGNEQKLGNYEVIISYKDINEEEVKEVFLINVVDNLEIGTEIINGKKTDYTWIIYLSIMIVIIGFYLGYIVKTCIKKKVNLS